MSENPLQPEPTVNSEEQGEDDSLPWFSEEPPKPPERYRREEALLWVWRAVLVIAILPTIVFAYMGSGGEIGWLSAIHLEDPGMLPAVQIGLLFVLGAEMVYYFYLSWTFRHFRDWGLVFWALAMVTMVFGVAFPVGS